MNNVAGKWKWMALLCVSGMFLLPLLLMLLASVKPAEQLTGDPYSLLPDRVLFQNYRDALESIPYVKYLANSIVL